ncbi:hypothetical protein [Parvularcula sp. LCG005]|uniref:hypothetical protein n=1 Tax=Parvularcula sp. LCG005 TaxID=3078805 RepID=UPI002942E7A0|nr:hypothetical protein [Parvularcula sp. LCG005]WOI52443.1 hypothetical protein RUI03_09810 [Parvularcula sp. LCG005]
MRHNVLALGLFACCATLGSGAVAHAEWVKLARVTAGNVGDYKEAPQIKIDPFGHDTYRVTVHPPFANLFVFQLSEHDSWHEMDFDHYTYCLEGVDFPGSPSDCLDMWHSAGIEYASYLSKRDLMSYIALAKIGEIENWSPQPVSYITKSENIRNSFVHSTIRPDGYDGGYYYTIDLRSFLEKYEQETRKPEGIQ